MRICPQNGNIIVLPVEQTTKSGIVLTEKSANDTYMALVIACDSGTCVSEGDKILFSKYNKAIEVKIEDRIHYVINDKDVMAILKQ